MPEGLYLLHIAVAVSPIPLPSPFGRGGSMTNQEILESLAFKKSEKIKKASDEVRREQKEKEMRKRGLAPDGSPVSGKGHKCYYSGKKLDREKFQMAMDAVFSGIPINKAYKLSGVSYPTFTKYARQLCSGDCMLPGERFTDGKPMYFTYNPPSELTLIKRELERLEKRKK